MDVCIVCVSIPRGFCTWWRCPKSGGHYLCSLGNTPQQEIVWYVSVLMPFWVLIHI